VKVSKHVRGCWKNMSLNFFLKAEAGKGKQADGEENKRVR